MLNRPCEGKGVAFKCELTGIVSRAWHEREHEFPDIRAHSLGRVGLARCCTNLSAERWNDSGPLNRTLMDTMVFTERGG